MASNGQIAIRMAKKRLSDIARRAENVDSIWPKVGSIVAREARRTFTTRGKSIGKPWVPLASSTRKQKAKLGYGRVPLVRTGEMKRSFTSRPMSIEQYYKDHAIFGSNSQIAFWQQHGTRLHGKRHIPPRTLLYINDAAMREMRQKIAQYIIGRTVTRKKKP